jgi:hypothetical protein
MHIHLPKTLHGWRDVAKEIGIIVVGVLIALGAEQIVKSLHWRSQVNDTKGALGAEIGASLRYAAERLAVQQCVRGRIAELTTRLRQTNEVWIGDPMPIGKARWMVEPNIPAVYRSPAEPWRTDAWETAKSTGTLNHMSRDEVAGYSINYDAIAELRGLQEAENALEPKLSFLSFDQQLDPRSRAEAMTTLAELDWVNGNIALLSRHLVQGAPKLDLKLDAGEFNQALRKDIEEQRTLRGACVRDIDVRI